MADDGKYSDFPIQPSANFLVELTSHPLVLWVYCDVRMFFVMFGMRAVEDSVNLRYSNENNHLLSFLV